MTDSFEFPLQVLIMHSDPIVAIGLQAFLALLPGHQIALGNLAAPTNGAHVIICDESSSQKLDVRSGSPAVVVLARRPKSFEIYRALKRGVLGYVAESSPPEEISSAVLAGGQGRRYLCRLSAQELANDFNNEQLTTRECAVLAQLARGRCNKVIAKELDIAIGTVKSHVRSILAKLNASSRTEAASIAMVRGFVPESALN